MCMRMVMPRLTPGGWAAGLASAAAGLAAGSAGGLVAAAAGAVVGAAAGVGPPGPTGPGTVVGAVAGAAGAAGLSGGFEASVGLTGAGVGDAAPPQAERSAAPPTATLQPSSPRRVILAMLSLL